VPERGQRPRARLGRKGFPDRCRLAAVPGSVDEDGNSYRLSGAVWFGATGNAQQETGQETFTAHLNLVAEGGGVVDKVAQTGHFDFARGGFLFDKGTCMA